MCVLSKKQSLFRGGKFLWVNHHLKQNHVVISPESDRMGGLESNRNFSLEWEWRTKINSLRDILSTFLKYLGDDYKMIEPA